MFMDHDGTAVLADFGFAKSLDSTKMSLQVATFQMGTIHWMSPEMIRDENFTFASDVYAFGIIVWEILSCEIPYAGFTKKRLLEDAVLAGERPPVDASWPAEARELMQKTWCMDPFARLKASDVVKRLSLPYNGPAEAVVMKGAPPVKADAPAPVENVAELMKMGKHSYAKKQFAEAMIALRRVIWADADKSAESLSLLSKCLQDSGDFVGALVVVERLLQLDPKHSAAMKDLKELQKYLGLQKWYRLDGSAPLSLTSDLARAKQQVPEQIAASNFASALRSLHFILLFEPTNAAALRSVGVCLQKLNKFKEAAFAFQVLVGFVSEKVEKQRIYENIASIFDYLKLAKDAANMRKLANEL